MRYRIHDPNSALPDGEDTVVINTETDSVDEIASSIRAIMDEKPDGQYAPIISSLALSLSVGVYYGDDQADLDLDIDHLT